MPKWTLIDESNAYGYTAKSADGLREITIYRAYAHTGDWLLTGFVGGRRIRKMPSEPDYTSFVEAKKRGARILRGDEDPPLW